MVAINNIILILTSIYGTARSYEAATNYLTACAGKAINVQETKCPRNAQIKLSSLTIYASTDAAAIDGAAKQCLQVSECKRVIHNEDDFGLSPTYLHLYRWFADKCQGKAICGSGTLPEWWTLTGEIKDNAGGSRMCPQSGTKYFTGILLHIECLVGEEVQTVQPPPATSPITRPTTPTSTTAFPVFIPIYLGGLEDREKIILGVAIGLAIMILIVLLLILYCCERYQKHRSFLKLLRMLGAPQAKDNLDEYEDYSKTEIWTDEAINPDALGEYTGVKPDEFLTMSKQAMMNTGQIMYDSAFGTMTTTRRNSCSTLTRANSGLNSYLNMEAGTPGGHNGPMAYDTEENLELERRMAAVLDECEEPVEEEDNTTHSETTRTDVSNKQNDVGDNNDVVFNDADATASSDMSLDIDAFKNYS